MDLTRRPLPDLDDTDALDATLADEDWPLVLDLWRSGVTNAGIYRLLRLRCVYRRRGDPALDGFGRPPGRGGQRTGAKLSAL